jgi:bile acid:Na+ symporter, BASS family
MMSLDRLINILVAITLAEMMVLIGLRATFAELVRITSNRRLVARAAAANYLFVPDVAVVLLILFAANPAVAAGFLILAVCPGAPFGPPFAGVRRRSAACRFGRHGKRPSDNAIAALAARTPGKTAAAAACGEPTESVRAREQT